MKMRGKEPYRRRAGKQSYGEWKTTQPLAAAEQFCVDTQKKDVEQHQRHISSVETVVLDVKEFR